MTELSDPRRAWAREQLGQTQADLTEAENVVKHLRQVLRALERLSASQTPETGQGYTDPRTRAENPSAARSGHGAGYLT